VRIHISFVVGLLALTCQAGQSADLIGTVIPPYPAGWKHLGGACLTYRETCDFAISDLKSPSATYVVIGKSARSNDPREPRWLVTDILQPRVPAGHHIESADCRLNGKIDGTILAVVKTTDTEWFKNVLVAYRVKLPAGRFEKISTKGVQCARLGED
jgi:hypothetical protein